MKKEVKIPETLTTVETKFRVISTDYSRDCKTFSPLFGTYAKAEEFIAQQILMNSDREEMIFQIEAYHGKFKHE